MGLARFAGHCRCCSSGRPAPFSNRYFFPGDGGWGSAQGLGGMDARSRDEMRCAGQGCTSGRGCEVPGGVESGGGITQPFLWLLSGSGDSWVSTGLYLPNGQNAEVSLSEAAVFAGLKVRPERHCHISEPQSFILIQLATLLPGVQEGIVLPTLQISQTKQLSFTEPKGVTEDARAPNIRSSPQTQALRFPPPDRAMRRRSACYIFGTSLISPTRTFWVSPLHPDR